MKEKEEVAAEADVMKQLEVVKERLNIQYTFNTEEPLSKLTIVSKGEFSKGNTFIYNNKNACISIIAGQKIVNSYGSSIFCIRWIFICVCLHCNVRLCVLSVLVFCIYLSIWVDNGESRNVPYSLNN